MSSTSSIRGTPTKLAATSAHQKHPPTRKSVAVSSESARSSPAHSTTSSKSGTPTVTAQCSSSEGGVGATSSGKSKWLKLFSALKKSKSGVAKGDAIPEEAYKLKHSHNCSNQNLRAGISNMKGYKKTNQDRCTAFSYLENDPDLAFFGVYDGHGGTGVANYLKDNLHQYILDQTEYKEGNMEEAILKAFLQADQELRSYGQATELTGSTATLLMIKHGQLFVANLGDSRAIACVLGLSKPLTCDHNTNNPKERERVLAMGGAIKENRVGGVLIPTRSFGDFLLKSELDKPAWKQVISAVPQIQSFKINSNWEFVVMATDGVWDAMTNQEIIAYFRSKLGTTSQSRERLTLSEICEELLDHCCAKTVERYGKNSCDNMTVILVCFDHGCDKSSETGSSSVVSSTVSR